MRKNSNTPDSTEYTSVLDAAEKIYSQEGGLSGLFTGCLQDTAKTVADSFLFFLAYNYIRQSRLRSHNGPAHHLPALEELSVGVLAGAFSKLLTTPIANVVTRLQTSSMVAARSNGIFSTSTATVRSVANDIRSEKGLQGFWSGYSASLILTLNPSLTFFFFETFKRVTLARHRRADPPALATFILAAMSKALASAITYPFSLAKSRAQASSRLVEETDSDIKKDIREATDGRVTGTKRTRDAARNTVFSTILHIATTEGTSALYEGLGAEVMKGFFSHGITMLVKDMVHKSIIRLYYAILRLLQKYPSPQELVEKAKEGAQQNLESVRSGAQTAVANGRELAERGSNIASNAWEGAKTAVQSGGESVKSGTTSAAEQVSDKTSGTYNKGKEVAEQGSNMASNAWEGAKTAVQSGGESARSGTVSAAEKASDKASGTYNKGKELSGEAASNAAEKKDTVAEAVGQKLEEAGRAIRSDKKADDGDH